MAGPTFQAAHCGEFPNDNQELHCGTVWRERGVLYVRAGLRAIADGDAGASSSASVDEGVDTETTEANYDDGPAIEIVDELTFADTVDEAPLGGDMEDDLPPLDEAPEAGDAPAEPSDLFTTFVEAMCDVAQSFGAGPDGVVHLRALLGQARIEGVATEGRAAAWQGIIRGESEDFGPCGAQTLDEWAAGIVASVVSGSGRKEAIRSELRGRGIAAFGFMAQSQQKLA